MPKFQLVSERMPIRSFLMMELFLLFGALLVYCRYTLYSIRYKYHEVFLSSRECSVVVAFSFVGSCRSLWYRTGSVGVTLVCVSVRARKWHTRFNLFISE